MPRRHSFCVNQPLVDFLDELVSDLNGNLQRTVKKALRNLQLHPTPVLNKQDALAIHGVGQWLATQIEVYIANNPSKFSTSNELVTTLQEHNSGDDTRVTSNRVQPLSTATILPNNELFLDVCPPSHASRDNNQGGVSSRSRPGRVVSVEENAMSDTENGSILAVQPVRVRARGRGRARTEKREGSYRPEYRSAPYGIMIALHAALTTGKTSMKKVELAEAAQSYCDVTILTSSNEEQHTWYDGWSCVNKTLIRKGLVAKFSNPAKFQLTVEGRLLAESLAKEHKSAQQPITMSCGSQIPSFKVPCNNASPVNHVIGSTCERGGAATDKVETSSNLVPLFSGLEPQSDVTAHRPDTRLSQLTAVVGNFNRNDDVSTCEVTIRPAVTSSDPPDSGSLAVPAPTITSSRVNATVDNVRANSTIITAARASSYTLPLSGACGTTLVQQQAVAFCEKRQDQIFDLPPAPRLHGSSVNGQVNQCSRAENSVNSNAASSQSEQYLVPILPGCLFEQGKRVLHCQYEKCVDYGPVYSERILRAEESRRSSLHVTAFQPTRKEQINLIDNSGLGMPVVTALTAVSMQNSRLPVPLPLEPISRPPSKRFSETQVERSVRVIKRLSPFSEEMCLIVLADIFEKGDFPRTDDKLYEVLSDKLWEKEQECANGRLANESVVDRVTQLRDSLRGPLGRITSSKSAASLRDGNDDDLESDFIRPITAHSASVACRNTNVETIDLELESQQPDLAGNPNMTKRASSSQPIIFIDDDSDENGVVLLNSSPPSIQPSLTKRARRAIVLDEDEPVHSQFVDEQCHDHEQATGRDSTVLSLRVPQKENQADSNVGHSYIRDCNLPDAEVISFEFDSLQNGADQQKSVDMSVQNTDEGPQVTTLRTAVLEANNEDKGIRGSVLSKCKVYIVLDKMERFRNGSNDRWRTVARLLEKAGALCVVRTLPCGDAMFIAQYEDGSEVMLDYIVERKTVEDYASSVRDGRVSRQAYMMRQSDITHRIFVIEGNIKNNPHMNDNSESHKRLAELEVCEDFYVKYTKDLMDTVWFYASLRRRLEEKYENIQKETLFQGRFLFDDWLERMKRITRGLILEQLFVMQLCQTPGVGEGRARAVVRKGFKTPQLLHRAFAVTMEVEREMFLKNKVDGISGSVSQTIFKLFHSTEYNTVMATSSRSRTMNSRQLEQTQLA